MTLLYAYAIASLCFGSFSLGIWAQGIEGGRPMDNSLVVALRMVFVGLVLWPYVILKATWVGLSKSLRSFTHPTNNKGR